jgi:histone H2B
MAPKPASTGGKAPAAASKAPAKTTEGKKAAKKTSKAPADGEKKKRKKTRKETYSSYIYKGTSTCSDRLDIVLTSLKC